MDKHLERLRNGGSFDEFVIRTKSQWRAIAMRLMQRWKCPSDVEVEDVIQEMLMGVHVVLPDYDPSRGKTLAQYAVWNAINRAKKWMHRQRGALRRDDKSISRHPIAMSRLSPSALSESSPFEDWLSVEGDQEQGAEKSRHVTMIERLFEGDVRVRETVRIIVQVDGDLSAAAMDILSRRHELGLRISSFSEAVALAQKVAAALIAV
jgi:RNA polymerase sigma factor (sigma-70 family)